MTSAATNGTIELFFFGLFDLGQLLGDRGREGARAFVAAVSSGSGAAAGGQRDRPRLAGSALPWMRSA